MRKKKKIANEFERSAQTYFNEIGDFNPLSKDEEMSLWEQYKKNNDINARDKIIKSNLKFVASVAKPFQGLGLSYSDLIAEGNMGLLKAIDKFDYERGFKTISYSVWWIRQTIMEALHNRNLIKGDDVHHIKNVMRFKEGDEFLVSDEHEEYLVKLLAISKEVSFEKIKKIENNSQLPFIVDIYQGYPKSDKLDDICKHSTELGVSKVYAILSKRNVVKLDPSRYQSKIERFNRIMKEASEQSHRNTKASFGGIFKLKDVDFSSYDLLLCPYEESSRENEKSLFKIFLFNLF